MLLARPGPEPSVRRVRWSSATRIIASRYPPIDLFERVSPDPEVWDALMAAEQLVNPRIRDEIGEIHLVPAEERVSGPGATYVMASFIHLNPKGSRFSDGSYGVYYAAQEFETALKETAYQFTRYATDSADGPRYEDMRVLVGRINNRFHDISTMSQRAQEPILDPSSYIASQPFGATLRNSGSNGITYPSVRNAGGRCVGAFRPNVVGLPTQTKHIKYYWDGQTVTRYFDFEANIWIPINS